ncbi:MAG: Rid family detoxifying hydrolase [Acidobacteriota bacterium]
MRRVILTVSIVIIVCVVATSVLAADERKVFYLGEKPADLPFSPAVLADDTLYVSGLLAVNPETGKFEGGTMTQQAERVLANMEILLKKAGMGLEDVVQATVYITDFAEFAEFNAVFRKVFPQAPPARATVQVARLAMDAKIEISAIAVK